MQKTARKFVAQSEQSRSRWRRRCHIT